MRARDWQRSAQKNLAVNIFKVTRRSQIISGAGNQFIANIPGELINKALNIAESSIIDNILMQRQADGTALKKNRRSTIQRKIEKGQANPKSLIDEQHRFIQKRQRSWKHKILGKGTAKWSAFIYPATAELKDLNKEVQIKGYRGWFAPSKQALILMCEMVRNEIRDMVLRKKNARQK